MKIGVPELQLQCFHKTSKLVKNTHTHTQNMYFTIVKKSNMVSQTSNQKDILSMIMIIYEALHNL